MRKIRLISAGLCGALLLAGYGVAHAAQTIDPGKVQALAAQIESALAQLGPGATAQQDIAAIQSAIASSGATPQEAEAALQVVESSSGLSQTASVAVASVDQEIQIALVGSGPAAGGGPGGSAALGSPPAYVSGGGSDYLVR